MDERGGLAWDRRLGARAAGIACVVTVVILMVVAATDEGGPWPQRLGMTAALAPVAGALGALASVRIAAARGELRALAAMGAGPLRATLGAVIGGAAVGIVGPFAAAVGLADLASLFPRPPAAHAWILEGSGLRETTLGITVDASGTLGLGARAAASLPPVPPGATGLAVLALVLSAVVGPAWLVRGEGGSPARRAAVGAAAIAAAIAAFQMVAAGRLSPWALVAAPVVLLVDAAAG